MTSRRHPNHRDQSTLPRELRRTTVPVAVRAWIERAVGTAVVRVQRLPGASTTAVHRIRLADDSSAVLRRYVWPVVLEDEPIAPRRELDALLLADARGLPVPRIVAADVTGDEIGDGVPAVLMTLLPGQAVAAPDAVRLAEVAAAIHDTDPGDFAHDYFRWFDDLPPGAPAAAGQPELWERALDLLRATPMPAYRPTFIHRDFHPGNVLWQRRRCSGVVDWADACRGPAGCDVATCRGELIRLCGVETADSFRQAYETVTGEPHDPYWELVSVFEHAPAAWTAREIADTEPRLAFAIQAMHTGS